MDRQSLADIFIAKIQSLDEPAQLLKWVQGQVTNSSAKYLDTPIPFLYHPVFWSQEEIEVLRQAGVMITSILHKVVKAYLDDPEFRKEFNFDPLTEELILLDPGYQNPAPMARFDLLFHADHKFKFCEFNTDGSSGMNEDNVLAQIFLQTPPLLELRKTYNLTYFELLDSWVEACLENYWEFKGSKELPTVAIVDWEGVSTIREFEAFQQAFQAKGCPTVITDPRKLRFKNGRLYCDNLPIDLVYRRLVNHEVIRQHEEITDFLKAYREQAVCVVGPLRSQILHNKIIFKVLNDQKIQNLFTKQEQAFIKRHIPYTAAFKDDKELLDIAMANKNTFVLKPQDLYGSKGVFVGKDYSEEKWYDLLLRCWDTDYLLQEFIEPPENLMLTWGLNLEHLKQILGLYLYNGQMAGLYTRVGKNNVISTSTGGFVVPNFLYS